MDDDDAWAALDEAQGNAAQAGPSKAKARRKAWMPADMDPVLKELPKWSLLAEVLLEIEGEILRTNPSSALPRLTLGSNTVLIMISSTRTLTLVSDFLASMDADAAPGTQGRAMMERKLRLYLWWKGKLGERKKEGRGLLILCGSTLLVHTTPVHACSSRTAP